MVAFCDSQVCRKRSEHAVQSRHRPAFSLAGRGKNARTACEPTETFQSSGATEKSAEFPPSPLLRARPRLRYLAARGFYHVAASGPADQRGVVSLSTPPAATP